MWRRLAIAVGALGVGVKVFGTASTIDDDGAGPQIHKGDFVFALAPSDSRVGLHRGSLVTVISKTDPTRTEVRRVIGVPGDWVQYPPSQSYSDVVSQGHHKTTGMDGVHWPEQHRVFLKNGFYWLERENEVDVLSAKIEHLKQYEQLVEAKSPAAQSSPDIFTVDEPQLAPHLHPMYFQADVRNYTSFGTVFEHDHLKQQDDAKAAELAEEALINDYLGEQAKLIYPNNPEMQESWQASAMGRLRRGQLHRRRLLNCIYEGTNLVDLEATEAAIEQKRAQRQAASAERLERYKTQQLFGGADQVASAQSQENRASTIVTADVVETVTRGAQQSTGAGQLAGAPTSASSGEQSFTSASIPNPEGHTPRATQPSSRAAAEGKGWRTAQEMRDAAAAREKTQVFTPGQKGPDGRTLQSEGQVQKAQKMHADSRPPVRYATLPSRSRRIVELAARDNLVPAGLILGEVQFAVHPQGGGSSAMGFLTFKPERASLDYINERISVPQSQEEHPTYIGFSSNVL